MTAEIRRLTSDHIHCDLMNEILFTRKGKPDAFPWMFPPYELGECAKARVGGQWPLSILEWKLADCAKC